MLDVIGKSQATYKHVFGFAEWRSACEVGFNAVVLWQDSKPVRRCVTSQARLRLLAGFGAKHSLVSTAAITCLPQLLQAAYRARCSPVLASV